MPVSDTLRRSFQYWKRRNYHRPAHEIIKRARMDERDKVTQYPDPLPGPRIKRPTGSALYWFERPADIGLREVDHADEIYPEAIKHRGWYTDDDRMNETVRGHVWQLPAKNGRARYVSGFQDPWNDGQGVIDRHDITIGDSREEYDDQARREAALAADSIAERYAEEERDYQRAWRAGADAQEALEEAANERRELIEALQEHRKERERADERPALCAAFRKYVRDTLAHIRDRQALARSLAADFGHCDGFTDH